MAQPTPQASHCPGRGGNLLQLPPGDGLLIKPAATPNLAKPLLFAGGPAPQVTSRVWSLLRSSFSSPITMPPQLTPFCARAVDVVVLAVDRILGIHQKRPPTCPAPSNVLPIPKTLLPCPSLVI